LKGGSIDFAPEHALSLASGMFISNRWVYISLMINWSDAAGGIVAAEQDSFVKTTHKILTLVSDGLGSSL